ncbi:MAG: hypothetical protein V1899_02445 [Planctomycetota bacterium]
MKTQRGVILIVCLVLLGVLMTITLSLSSRFAGNNASIEREIASTRALELAQGACMWDLQQIWADYKGLTRAYPQDRVVWLGVTSNDDGDRQRTGAELPPAALSAKYNPTWRIFGQGEIKVICTVFGAVPADFSYVDIKLDATARVASDSLVRTGTPEEKLRWMYRQVQQIVRINFTQQSRVFDFAYFVNNYGWMYDNGNSVIRIYGTVGSNGNLGFNRKPIVDGDLFAALNPAIGATGVVNGLNLDQYGVPTHSTNYVVRDTLPVYRAGANLPASDQALLMPGNPGYTEDVNGNGRLDTGEDIHPTNGRIDSIEYTPGYDATTDKNKYLYEKQNPLEMPYMGDLSYMKQKATAKNGKIEQLRKGGNPAITTDWEMVVNNVYGSTVGQNGIFSTYNAATQTVTRTAITQVLEPAADKQDRNGNVALIGTSDQPLRITGPVVITNDLVIKGTISGQGTIYTGRNLHIVGDLTYKDPPSWTLNDPNFASQAITNASKDMVGFASKGSVILGQYYRMVRSDKTPISGMYDDSDGWGTARYYFKSGFQNNTLQAYQADPTDQSIGYYDPITHCFHGDYTIADGGQRYDDANYSTKIARNYYESSFPDTYIQSLCAARPAIIQGLFYTNHLYGGRPQNVRIMGSLVARDEGIIFNGFCRLFYDPRSASSGDTSSRVDIFLPPTTGYNVWLWQEIAGAH